jgi:hypothetical protein
VFQLSHAAGEKKTWREMTSTSVPPAWAKHH